MITPDLYTKLSMFIVVASAMEIPLLVTLGLKPFVRITDKHAFVDAATPPVSPENIPFTRKPEATAKPIAKDSEMKKKRLLLR